MRFDFGENLKTLRNAKGLTQEQVAELLNVSKQSVSRWENNVTYPDITFLPILASFYCVTVDALLGADYETNKTVLADYQAKRDEAHHQGDISVAYELSQELYALFPNEKSVINNMMTDAYLMGFHNVNGKKKHYLEMSISIAERFLKMTEDLREECRCIQNISVCNKLLGNQEKAVTWMKKLPGIRSGMESTALGVLDGADKMDAIQTSLDAILHMVHRLIFVYATESATLSTEERIRALKKIPQVFDVILEDGDYGYYNIFLSRVYVELAKLSADDKEKNQAYTSKAIAFAQTFDNLTAGKHTSVLMRGREIAPDQITKSDRATQVEKVTKALSDLP